jgi:hypothetical protein
MLQLQKGAGHEARAANWQAEKGQRTGEKHDKNHFRDRE